MTVRSDPFAPFVPRVAARWPEQADSWRAVEGSLVFSDVSGFTALSERLAKRGKLGAEQMTDLLDAVFERLLGAALGLGGDLLAFGGDALCLLFDGPGHPERAAATAAALQRALRVRTPAHAAVGRISLGMSIGVHTGPVHLMRVGSTYRQLLAFGATVSTTLALEGAANRDEVLVSPQLARHLPDGSVGPPDRGGHLLLRPPEVEAVVLDAAPVDLVAAELIAPRIRPELQNGAPAEHRTATISFLKAEGTDDLIAAAPEGAVHSELDALVSEVQDIAARYEVTLLDPDVYPNAIKFLVAAGVPTATADDADRMLEAARAMVRIDTPLVLRAGVNGGRVFAGPVGGRDRRSYTVIGDTVNLAARLMAHAPAKTVLAPETLLDRARTRFARTSLEPFSVKGKSEPIRAAVVGEPTASGHWDRTELSPLVGRDAERRILLDAWDRTAAGTGAVVELVGEPGIGKSRLVAELIEHSDGTRFVAEGGVYAATSPYRALIPALFRIVGIEDSHTEAEQGRRLAQFVAREAPQLEPWLPLLAIAFGIELPATPETTDLAPAFRRARLAELFVEFLVATLPGRLLVLVEDAHWLDEPSQELLTAVARAAVERPWLLALTRRPDPTGLILPDDLAATRIALAPLDATAAEELARSALDDESLPAQTVDAIVARAGGNPFFLHELLQAAKGGEDIDALPESMESLIAAGIDTLAPPDRQVLRQASVLGREFPERVLGDLVETARLGPTLERLERFLERDRGRLRFRHALLRQTAYEGLPFRVRAGLHLRAAVQFEDEAALPDEEAELLSLHFFYGRRFDKALHYSRVAADRARVDLAPVEAAVFYNRALDAARALRTVLPTERAQLEESLADVEERASHYDVARSALRRARTLVGEDAVAKARLLQKDGWIEQRLGRQSQALALYSRALRFVETSRKPGAAALRADLRVVRAGVRQRQGRWVDSIKILRREIPRMTESRSPAALARAHFLLHSALAVEGDRSGLHHAHEAIRLFEKCGDLYGMSGVYNNLGVEAYDVGSWSVALEHYERARELAGRIGDVVEAATTMVNVGDILIDQGAFDEADAKFTGALQVFRGSGYLFGIAHASLDLGRLRARVGRFDEAHALFDVASEHFGAMGSHLELLETDGRRAEALVLERRSDAAVELGMRTLRAVAAEHGEMLFDSWLERLLGAAWFQLGDASAAREHWKASLAAAEEGGADFERALTLECFARLDDQVSAEAAEILDRLGVRTTITDQLLDGAVARLTTSA